MKIALIGTHGTGKTTLAYELVANLKKEGMNAGLVREIAGICPLPINEETTIESQKWMIYQQYCKEIEEQSRFPILVCDRSTLDDYAYYSNKFGADTLIHDFVKETIKEYDFLFRIPINGSYLKKDGIRSINPTFQKEIDRMFDFLLEQFSVDCYKTCNLKEILGVIKNGGTI